VTDKENLEEKEPEAAVVAEEAAAETIEEQLPEIDPLEALTAKLEQVKSQAAEYLDGWQRARAEFANYKRRVEAERTELYRSAGADLLLRLLPVVDDFDRAIQTIPVDIGDTSWINGITLIHRKLNLMLEASGVSTIPVEPGDTFDPSLHEAITHEDSEEFSNGQIIAETQRGYKLGERVLRPALVRVAR
jgi:molecular chaperone GrpE